MRTSPTSAKKFIELYDTTLRDGMQGMLINFTLKDKLAICEALDAFGIDFIEGGFPYSNPKEKEFFVQSKSLPLTHSKIVAFGSTCLPNRKATQDMGIISLLDADTEYITIVVKSSLSHVTQVLKTTQDENLRMLEDSIATLTKEGRKVIVDFEHFFDGFAENPEYSLSVVKHAYDCGAEKLVLCDTNGGVLLPQMTHALTSVQGLLADTTTRPSLDANNSTGKSIHPESNAGASDSPGANQKPKPSLRTSIAGIVGVHFHNDCELAVANSIHSLEYGASHIQGTINGWGERSGNANLCSIIPNLGLKDTRFQLSCTSHTPQLTSLSRFVAECANIIPDPRLPYVGHASFSHKAGQHADVIEKKESLMEHISPRLVGNERHILISELAGKSTIIQKLSKYGVFTKQSKEVTKLITVLKEKESLGYEYENAEASFELEMMRVLGIYTPLFTLKQYHIELFKTSSTDTKTIARIFLYDKNEEHLGAGLGIGPVETLDAALRSALELHYPFIKDIELSDFKVRVINPESNTSAKVRVFISSTAGLHDWNTVGVHQNIVEASWLALVDSFEYYYNVLTIEKKNQEKAKKKLRKSK